VLGKNFKKRFCWEGFLNLKSLPTNRGVFPTLPNKKQVLKAILQQISN
jgi:hypothetical protein